MDDKRAYSPHMEGITRVVPAANGAPARKAEIIDMMKCVYKRDEGDGSVCIMFAASSALMEGSVILHRSRSEAEKYERDKYYPLYMGGAE